MLKGFFGLDAYRIFGTPFLLANLVVGVAVIPLGVWLLKRLNAMQVRSPIVKRLINDLTDYNLNKATAFLVTLSDFEKEA